LFGLIIIIVIIIINEEIKEKKKRRKKREQVQINIQGRDIVNKCLSNLDIDYE
jgi:hypothetical protein